MPEELAQFYGSVMKLLYADNEKNCKPHVHVFYGGYQASVGVDGEALAGQLPRKQLRLLQAWLALHEEEVYAAWNNAVADKPFERIAPLQ